MLEEEVILKSFKLPLKFEPKSTSNASLFKGKIFLFVEIVFGVGRERLRSGRDKMKKKPIK
tara:strand:+ start:575 stop:757 length:183 start_codon:yes stop_codon:yes gene_type:complete